MTMEQVHRRNLNNYRKSNNDLDFAPPPTSSSSLSIEQLHRQYRRIFGKPHPTFVPPPPLPLPLPPPPPSFNVPQRPSKLQPSIILPHPLFPGVYVAADDHHHHDYESLFLYTRNLVPGVKSLDQDVVFSVHDDEDECTVEYREWDPFRSRLAAAILSGAQHIWIKPGSRVLVILSRDDAQFGITISHISDIVGPQGMVYVVGGSKSNCNSILDMADKRFNIVPIAHGFSCICPLEYNMLINIVDVLFAAPDADHLSEVNAACFNAKLFLKTGGHYMLYVQGNCIESTKRGDGVFSSSGKKDQVQFQRIERVTLEPFDRDHAYVSGVFRTLEIAEIDQSCLGSDKLLTSEDMHWCDGSLYQKFKNLPVYMLFESSCGYVLLRAHDRYKVELHYVATEEYIKNFDKSFEFVACHTFVSSDEALMYLTATINGTKPEKLLEFLVRHLPPKSMEGDEPCYSLELFYISGASEIVLKAKIPISSGSFDIVRGVRMNIDKVFKNLKPGDLEKAQVDLARMYCRQELDSPYKKRGAYLACFETRQNPKRGPGRYQN